MEVNGRLDFRNEKL